MVTRQWPARFGVSTRAGQERFGQTMVPNQASVQWVKEAFSLGRKAVVA